MAVRLVEIDFDTNAPAVQRQIDALKQEMEETTKTIEEAEEANEEYTKSFSDAAEQTKVFGVSLRDLQEALGNAGKAITGVVKNLGLLKTAIATIGLGAFAIALGGLISTLRTTEEGINLMNRATSGANLGWRIFTKTLRDAANGLKNLATGQKESNALTAEGEKNLRDIEDQLNKEREALETNNNARRAAINELELERATQKAAAEDVRATTDERLAAAADLKETTLAIQALRVQDIEDLQSINALEQEQAKILGENVIPLQTEAQDLADQSTAAQLTQQEVLLTNRNLVNTILAEQLALQLLNNAAIEEEIRLLAEKQAATGKQSESLDKQRGSEEGVNKVVTERVELFKDLDVLTEGLSEKVAALNEKETKALEDRIQLEQELQDIILSGFQLIGSLTGIIFSDNKRASIAAAFINIAVGVTKALAQGGILGVFRAAAIIAAGSVQINRIQQQDFRETEFAQGGMITGRPHSTGGVNINAEGGEFIINKRSMNIPGVLEAAQALNSLKTPKFQAGGLVREAEIAELQLERAINLLDQQQVVLVTEDLDAVQNRVEVTEDRSTL